MKKIISLVAAAAMMLTASATAFAAAKYPANSDAPKVTAHYAVTEVDADGWNNVSITFDLDDLGDLNATYASRKHSGLKLASFAISAKNSDEIAFDTDVVGGLSNINLGAAAAYGNSLATMDGKGFNLLFNTATASVAFPSTTGEEVKASAVDNAVTVSFWAAPGTITLSDAQVSYLLFAGNALSAEGNENAFRTVSIVNPTWTIGDACDCDECNPGAGDDEEEDTLTFAIAEGKIYDNGTVWACEIANAVDGLAKLEATFKAGEATKSVITTKLAAWGGEGATAFNIGVNTAKANVVADAIAATITDGAGATATAEAIAK